MLFFKHVTLLTAAQVIEDGVLLVREGRIAALGPAGTVSPPPEARVVDAQGLILGPGYIDLQINGGFGKDFTAEPESMYAVAKKLPRFGVTAFLATLITSPYSQVQEALELWSQGAPEGLRGAIPLGYHLEGPMINPQKKGAHNPAFIRLPSPDAIAGWGPESGVRLVTLAPELPQALEVIRALRQRGVVVSAGHTMATYDQALQAFAAGITCGTHLFNAMPTLDHRLPGIAAALMQQAGVRVGMIADGVHVHPAMIHLAWKARQPEGVMLVTDAIAALGMPPGTYRLGDFNVTVDGLSARLEDGTLAGSLLTMDAAVRNLMAFTGCSLLQAAACAASNPAQVLGLTHTGRLQAGLNADLVLLNPSAQVLATLVQGEVVYSNTPLLEAVQ
jgi:N-acetylglucosamine-6-phosphate deacetylase